MLRILNVWCINTNDASKWTFELNLELNSLRNIDTEKALLLSF